VDHVDPEHRRAPQPPRLSDAWRPGRHASLTRASAYGRDCRDRHDPHPIQGRAPATTATVAGEVAVMMSGTSTAPQIKAAVCAHSPSPDPALAHLGPRCRRSPSSIPISSWCSGMACFRAGRHSGSRARPPTRGSEQALVLPDVKEQALQRRRRRALDHHARVIRSGNPRDRKIREARERNRREGRLSGAHEISVLDVRHARTLRRRVRPDRAKAEKRDMGARRLHDLQDAALTSRSAISKAVADHVPGSRNRSSRRALAQSSDGGEEPNGTSILDVTDPKSPRYLAHVPGEPGKDEARRCADGACVRRLGAPQRRQGQGVSAAQLRRHGARGLGRDRPGEAGDPRDRRRQAQGHAQELVGVRHGDRVSRFGRRGWRRVAIRRSTI